VRTTRSPQVFHGRNGHATRTKKEKTRGGQDSRASGVWTISEIRQFSALSRPPNRR
jgi:hypothetical protein